MAIPAKALLMFDALAQPEPETIPNPAKVQARAEEIRRGWTPSQKRHRAQLARYLVWRKLLNRR